MAIISQRCHYSAGKDQAKQTVTGVRRWILFDTPPTFLLFRDDGGDCCESVLDTVRAADEATVC